MVETYAVVGASLAGGHAAHRLRSAGFAGRLVLIGDEPHLPYERPPLSKGILTGGQDAASTTLWPEPDFHDAHIELALGTRVTALLPGERRLTLADGRSLAVDRVLLATGSRPRALPVPGAEQTGVHALRTLDDAVRLREALAPGTRVVVVGAGFIGAEVAASARARGCDVTMIEVAALPLQRVLGPEFGRLYAELHRSSGVTVRLDAAVTEIRGDGRCRAVVLADGTELPADLVVYGVGAVPASELAAVAGIETGNGVLVDHFGRTSVPNVFAAGDVAARPSSFADRPVRLETWQNAQNQAISAADAMLGSARPFDEVPWFWSDQYDVNLQIAGLPAPTDEIVWRGDRETFDCTAFYLRDGVVRGAVGLNRKRDIRAAMDLVRLGVPVSAPVLADESVDLRALSRAANRTTG